jgi:DNA-directed RNA polymerase subunit omega
MARVTVEDCVTRVPNRFELVMVAAQRGRNIGAGAPLTLDRDNDKNAVVALREIAEAKVDLKELENGLIRGLQTVVEADEPEGEEMDLLPISEEVAEELGIERGEARADQVMSEDELHFEDDVAAAQDIADDLDLELGAVEVEDEADSEADSEGEGEAEGEEGDGPDLDKGEEPGPF